MPKFTKQWCRLKGKYIYTNDLFEIELFKTGWGYKILDSVEMPYTESCGYATSIHRWDTKKTLEKLLVSRKTHYMVVIDGDSNEDYYAYRYANSRFVPVET